MVLGRLLRGFSAGFGLGGVSVYLAEIATPGHKGFYVCWQSGSQQVAVIFAAFLGYLLHAPISPAGDVRLGLARSILHRLPHRAFRFFIRGSMEETEEFLRRKHQPAVEEVQASLARNWRIVMIGMMMVA